MKIGHLVQDSEVDQQTISDQPWHGPLRWATSSAQGVPPPALQVYTCWDGTRTHTHTLAPTTV